MHWCSYIFGDPEPDKDGHQELDADVEPVKSDFNLFMKQREQKHMRAAEAAKACTREQPILGTGLGKVV